MFDEPMCPLLGLSEGDLADSIPAKLLPLMTGIELRGGQGTLGCMLTRKVHLEDSNET
jgi:hypothetical protein